MDLIEALVAIKTLRDQINDSPMPADGSKDWTNPVLELLDKASDVIEFPSKAQCDTWA